MIERRLPRPAASAIACATAAAWPLTTIWPGELSLATAQTSSPTEASLATSRAASMSSPRSAAIGLEHPDDRERGGEQCRLRVFGQHQIALGPLEHQPREVLRQGVVDFFEELARDRRGFGEFLPHAGELRTLARKHKGPFHRATPPPAAFSPPPVIERRAGESSRAQAPGP